jgi:heme/copper-type cytochrome/quinol oxidase subunit 4
MKYQDKVWLVYAAALGIMGLLLSVTKGETSKFLGGMITALCLVAYVRQLSIFLDEGKKLYVTMLLIVLAVTIVIGIAIFIIAP